MRLSEEQRFRWIQGAMFTTSHLVATRDKEKGACVSGWYLKDEADRHRRIEEMLTKYPTELPTTIILSLLTQACGPLLK